MQKGFKKPEWQLCQLRESLRGKGKKMITTGKCWLSSSPCASVSQAGLVLLLLHRGLEVSAGPLVIKPLRNEEGNAVRGQESRVKCRFDSVSTAAGS